VRAVLVDLDGKYCQINCYMVLQRPVIRQGFSETTIPKLTVHVSLTPTAVEDSMNVSVFAPSELDAQPMAAEIKSGTVLDRIVEARRAAIASSEEGGVPRRVCGLGVNASPARSGLWRGFGARFAQRDC